MLYPLVHVYIAMENNRAISWKIKYKWTIINSKLLNYQRVGGMVTMNMAVQIVSFPILNVDFS